MENEKPEEKPGPEPVSDRNTARTLLLATRVLPFKLSAFEGKQYAIQALSARDFSKLASKAAALKDRVLGSTTNPVWYSLCLIACLRTVGPDGRPGQPVFEDADLDGLLSNPFDASSILNTLGMECAAFITGDAPATVADAKNG
jgi:hypothetical protein